MNPMIIDLSRLNQSTEQAKLDEVCRTHGFFGLANHGIDPTLQKRFALEMQRYFDQPILAKLKHERTEKIAFGFYNKELTKNRLDQKEIFDISLSEKTLWPSDAEFVAVTSDWSQACHKVAVALLEHLFDCLGFRPYEDCFTDHTSFLRLNYYPHYEAQDQQFGVSHHTDAGVLTLLLQEQIASLQFKIDGEWHTVPASPEHLLVNLGDMLQVWSNDTYRAPLHRVITNAEADRYSAPYFLNPAYKANVHPLVGETPLYRTINWQEFRAGRAAGDYANIGEEIQISHYRLT